MHNLHFKKRKRKISSCSFSSELNWPVGTLSCSIIYSYFKPVTEIDCRVAQAKEAFINRKELLTKSLKKQTKIKIVKTLVWTTLLYGSETWTLRKEDILKLEALEMRLWRRMEKISWTDKVTQEDVLRRVGIERQPIYMLRSSKKSWIGHVLGGNGLLKEVLEAQQNARCITISL